MFLRRWRRRLPGYLFVACQVLAVVLSSFVLTAPLLDGGGPGTDLAGRVLALFARDAAVRRTALAAAVGLVATAFVFFRPPYGRPPRSPDDVIGA
jgi:hypothetical protein